MRDFLARSDLPFQWNELRTDEEARAVGVTDLSDPRLPVCVLGEATVLYRANHRRSGRRIGLVWDTQAA